MNSNGRIVFGSLRGNIFIVTRTSILVFKPECLLVFFQCMMNFLFPLHKNIFADTEIGCNTSAGRP